MGQQYDWEAEFRALHGRTTERIRKGDRDLARLFTDADRAFLKSIGSKPIEMFDAADDWANDGAPSLKDMLEVHRMRYEYFTQTQNGKWEPLVQDYRPKAAGLGGIPWLPRAIDKVRAKLRGRLIDDLFYPCGGDRSFLKGIKMSPPEFFRLVRDTDSEDEIVKKVQQCRGLS